MARVFVPTFNQTPATPTGAEFRLSGAAMGTSWSLRAIGDASLAAPLADAVALTLSEIIQQMSQWNASSDLSRFNNATCGAKIALPARLQTVLDCALEIAAETDGAFDPTLGALTDLWGFAAHEPAELPPRASDLAAARAGAGWRKLLHDMSAPLTQPGGMRLDLAGIAKGYAVDELARVLAEAAIHSFLIDIGGELRGAGIKRDGQPWWVEIERLPGSSAQPIVAALHNLAIATSGDYRRVRQVGERKISHTIDPRTGAPLQSNLASVTVLHRDCMHADAYATALMVLGADAGIAFANAHELMALFTLRGPNGVEERCSAAFAAQLA